MLTKIRKFLYRVAVHGLILSNYRPNSEPQNSLAVRFPELMLELLDDVVCDSPSFYDRKLVQIFDQIESVKKELPFRKEFKRLRKIATRKKVVWKGV